MTFSSPRRWLALGALLGLLAPAPVWAGLGEAQSSIEAEGSRLQARRSVAQASQYALHELTLADGSRLRQYVGRHGQVFAVSWVTLHKPQLASLLGSAFAGYRGAARQAAQRGGIQRQFRHESADLVVQSQGHLQVYTGYAYRRSLLPPGLRLPALGLG